MIPIAIVLVICLVAAFVVYACFVVGDDNRDDNEQY